MNNSQSSNDLYTPSEYAKSFAIAKEALGLVVKFHTPPTPEVYELWYRYSEGTDDALRDALNYCLNDAGTVSKKQMQLLKQTFFSASESAEANAKISEKLAEELGGLKSIVNEQLIASGEFDSSLGSVAENLRPDSTPSEARACIELALSCNEEMQGHLKCVTSKLATSQDHIDDMRESLLESQKLLLIDPVTEVGNRRFFDTMMLRRFEAGHDRARHNFLLIVDLDNFKEVNDTYGHSTGDRVLRYAASMIQQIAKEASVARYGGDEFAVFLESESIEMGKELGEAICQHFAKTSLTDVETSARIDRVTTSIGVSRLRVDDDRESWFNRADKLLYGAKQGGRNQVMAERDFTDSEATKLR